MRFIYWLPFIFYGLTILFVVNLPSGSGEQYVVTAINIVASILTSAMAVATFTRRGF